MISPDPTQRPTAADILAEEWLQECNPSLNQREKVFKEEFVVASNCGDFEKTFGEKGSVGGSESLINLTFD